MTHEDKRYLQDKLYHERDKELLLKDLCARLPYGVKVECKWKTPAPNGTYGMLCTLDSFLLDQIYNMNDSDVPFDEFKPYLFPMSSMTDEQKEELMELMYKTDTPFGAIFSENIDYFDWLNKNHFDYRGLIEKGLAIDATGLGIY